jgi:hypothetical protein
LEAANFFAFNLKPQTYSEALLQQPEAINHLNYPNDLNWLSIVSFSDFHIPISTFNGPSP